MDGAQWRLVVAELRRDSAACCRRCRSARTGDRCTPTPTCRSAGSGGSSCEFLERLDLRRRDAVLQRLVRRAGDDRRRRRSSGSGGWCSRRARRSRTTRQGSPAGWPRCPARMPGGVAIMRRTLLNRRLRRLPITFGPMSKRGVPDEVMRAVAAPIADREIRRDYKKYVGDTKPGKARPAGRDRRAASLTGPCSSCGRPRTSSCRRSTGGASPSLPEQPAWSRSPTATRSSRRPAGPARRGAKVFAAG